MASPTFRKWFWIGAGALGGVVLTRWQLGRWFTAQPHYELEQRLGELEIRNYGARWVAETTVTDASWDEALDEGFRRLAGYIFGDNHASPFQPDRLSTPDALRPALASRADDGHDSGYVIPMPAPTVARLTPRSETIAMTSPVNVSTNDDRSYTVVFNMPEGRTLASLPAPNDERVRLERRPRRRVAVLRYRGRYSGPKVAQKFSELLARVRVAGLGYRGSPEFAGYDPPTTLPFLRHNEVWLELEPS
jgi:SOUL heme-binding protein